MKAHGTVSRYKHDGCRCDPCRVAASTSGKRYYNVNRERLLAEANRRYADNPQRAKDYYKANRERLIVQDKHYREANPELARERRKRYREANPDYARQRWRAKRARAVARLGGKCVECGGVERLQFDHRDPETKSARLSCPKPQNIMSLGGRELEMELALCQLLCRGCHRRKTHAEICRRYYGLS